MATAEGRVIVSEDTDLGALLAQSGAIAPSFVLRRGSEPVTPDGQVALLVANLAAVEGELAQGAIVVFSRAESGFDRCRSDLWSDPLRSRPVLVGTV